MLQIAICDDEKIARDLLEHKIVSYMQNLKENYEIKCFSRAVELLQTSCTFDLFFLDIHMPGQDGLALAKKIRKNENQGIIIFITALQEHIYDAFEVEAFDYICKPIDETRLQKTLDRAIRKLRENKSLFIQTATWSKMVKLKDIYYCEVINRKIHLHTKSGLVEYYSKLGDVEKQLDYRFIRCHRSYLVNMDYMSEYSDGEISLENGERIPTSRLRHQDFMEAMMSYMKRRGI